MSIESIKADLGALAMREQAIGAIQAIEVVGSKNITAVTRIIAEQLAIPKNPYQKEEL